MVRGPTNEVHSGQSRARTTFPCLTFFLPLSKCRPNESDRRFSFSFCLSLKALLVSFLRNVRHPKSEGNNEENTSPKDRMFSYCLTRRRNAVWLSLALLLSLDARKRSPRTESSIDWRIRALFREQNSVEGLC